MFILQTLDSSLPTSLSLANLPTMGPRNPTGFDMAEFKAAASPKSAWAKRDPWARKYVLVPNSIDIYSVTN